MVEPRTLVVTERSLLRRKRERGSYDRALIDAILDEALVCHVGYSDGGSPFVVPMTYGRRGDTVYLHGAPGNHTLRVLAGGTPACLTVTLLDGLVLSRAAVHHSMNFRTVILFGTARPVEDAEEKLAALESVIEHAVPGRSAHARSPSPEELRTTLVVAFPVGEGSAKVRTGGPLEDAEDMGLAVWAGHVPLQLTAAAPVADAGLAPDVAEPDYLRQPRFLTA